MACSLLRRSAKRHRIAVSAVPGQRASLTSMPSPISRQLSLAANSAANLRSSALGAPMMSRRPVSRSHARFSALDMPRSAIHTRPTTPWRASMVSTMVCTVRLS
jgi:hypothetical protein